MEACPAPACGVAAIGGESHANSVCISAPFGGIGGLPLMSTSDASRAGQFVAQFPEALARQWLTSRGADQAERGACCAPDKQVFSGALCCVGAVFGWWCGSVWQACWGEPARHCGPAAPIGAMSLYGYNANTLHHFIAEVQCGPGASGVGSQTALLRRASEMAKPEKSWQTIRASGVSSNTT